MAKPSLCLHTYTLEPLAVLGQVEVQVKHQGYIGRKQLFIVQGNGPSLRGRDWLGDIKLDWVNIRNLSDKVVQKYPEVFKSESNSSMTHLKAYLRLKERPTPRFFRPRPVPFDAVGKELDHLERVVSFAKSHTLIGRRPSFQFQKVMVPSGFVGIIR